MTPCPTPGCRAAGWHVYAGHCYRHRTPDWTQLEAQVHGWPIPAHHCNGCQPRKRDNG